MSDKPVLIENAELLKFNATRADENGSLDGMDTFSPVKSVGGTPIKVMRDIHTGLTKKDTRFQKYNTELLRDDKGIN